MDTQFTDVESQPQERRRDSVGITRRQLLKGAAVVAGGTLVSGIAVACAPAPTPTPVPAPQPTTPPAPVPTKPIGPSGKLTVAQSFSPRVLSPHVAGGPQEEINVAEQFVEKLFEWTPDATDYEPRLATSWKQIDDTTLQIKLRPNVKFTNGEALDADSVKFSVERMLKEPAYAAFSGMLAGCDVVDSSTVNVKTKYPTLLHMPALAWGGFVEPMKYFQQVGPDVFGTKPIGTGPFKFVDWAKDSHVTMEANDSYWAGPPPMKTIVVKVIPEGVARMAALETGEVDFAINVPLDVIDRLQGNPNLQLFSRPSNRLFSLQFSTRNDTPIRNPKVRQALQYAIDTDGMIQALFKGRAVRLAGQLLSPSYFGYDPQRKATPYDPDKAKKLLADAGYPNGFDCVFKYSAGRYVQDKEVGQTIASQLAKVGVRVKQEVLESGTLITQLQTNQLNDMSLSGSMPPPDAYFMWSSWLSSSLYNYWSNQQFEALMDKSARTANRDERISLYKQCLDIFDQDPPGVPLYQPLEFYAASKKLSGFTPRAMQFLDLRTFKI